MDNRETSVTIPVSEIPFVARAMGFYPTEQEVCILSAFWIFHYYRALYLFIYLFYSPPMMEKYTDIYRFT